MAAWELRLDPQRICEFADRYDVERDSAILAIGRSAREYGEFAYDGFLTVCYWKTARSCSRCRKNKPEEVAEVTKVSLSTNVERLRMESLRCLHGVDWSTASVLLHIAHPDPYPILDFRALWSLSVEQPASYSFGFWWRYVVACRTIAKQLDVDMRTLDRALWQYSKEHQPVIA